MPIVSAAMPADSRVAEGTPELRLNELLEHRAAVYRVCLGFAAHADDAEDLTHDVYERALRHNADWQGPEHARLWLFRVARNVCLDYRRRLRVRQLWAPWLVSAGSEAGDPGRDAERDEQIRSLKRAVARLPRKLQEALVLREYGGLSYREISTLLALSTGTVMSRLHNARRRVQRFMEEDHESRKP
jgi:RNA polymerase sigma factor (sigma-70 family)